MLSQTQGSHRAVRRGGRDARGGQVKPSPRVPEQRYDEYRGLMVRPGLPTMYVPPVYTPAPANGRRRAYGQPTGPYPQYAPRGPYPAPRQPGGQPGRTTVPGSAAAPAVPPPSPPSRQERNPDDTYRPSYEQAASPRPEGGRAAVRRAARERKVAQRPEVLRRLVPQALVVAFLAGGTSAFVAHDKEVRLSVDGSSRTLHTFAGDVGELLSDEGVELGEHDSVGPSPGRTLADGDEIAFSHGRPLDLTLDGTRHRVWTTARTVHDALRRMGVRTQGAALSLAPSADIPRGGLRLEVRTERTVIFLADGEEKSLRTNAGTVLEALTEAGIELDGLDATSAPMDSFPHDGQTVTVMRITGSEKVKEERIAFKTVRHADPQLPQGTEVVAREGRTGLRRVTYRLRTVNGVREKPRRIAVEVLRHPRKQIIRVGTLPLPQSVPGADHLDWAALAQCESGNRPGAVDASGHHGGLYQFDTPTWHALGGSGRPQHAPAQEQTYRAKKLYVSQGASPWPYCGRKLSR